MIFNNFKKVVYLIVVFLKVISDVYRLSPPASLKPEGRIYAFQEKAVAVYHHEKKFRV